MIEPGLRDAGTLLHTILFDSLATTDQILDQFFREHHSGQMERTRISALVFHGLRHRRVLEKRLQAFLPDSSLCRGPELAIAALASQQDWPDEPLRTLLGVGSALSGHIPPSPLSLAEQLSLPDWLWQRWQAQFGTEQAEALGIAMNQPAGVDLRVNPLRTTRDKLIHTLAELNVHATPTPYAPMGVRLNQRYPLNGLTPFKQGLFEVHDEGSQLISPLLAPQPGWTVVDLCAGGGGKSLHLAALMQNRGKVIAADIEQTRLARIGARIKRAGARTIRTVVLRHERDPKLKGLEGRADAVLVDAPCSGVGTLRRHPEIKWRLQPQQVEAFHYRQCALLEAGARLTRPGGRLLYATCSLLQRENEDVARAFLADNTDFRLLSVPRLCAAKSNETEPPTMPFLTLLPHQTKTDGFFAALFQRTS